MKIVVIVRTLDEEFNIERFCQCYAQADKILIADGGSVDRTLEIAAQFCNVKIRHFHRRTAYPDGVFFNPEAMHVNYLIDWAIQDEQPDWLILDDVDCIPSAALYAAMTNILGNRGNAVCAFRLHILGESEYFPLMSLPGQSLWAWRPDELPAIRADDSLLETQLGLVGVPPKETKGRQDLYPPYVLLHYFAPTPAAHAHKLARYAARGTPQTPFKHSEYWPPQPLPTWGTPPKINPEVGKWLTPRLILTDRLTCYNCSVFVGRLPKWCGTELGKGWSCENCGTTAVNVDEGRPYGPQSARWDDLVKEFYGLLVDFADDSSYLDWLWTTVKRSEKC